MLINLISDFARKDIVVIDNELSMKIYDNGVHQYKVVEPLKTTLEVKRISKDEFIINGTATITLVIPCDRCSKDVRYPLDMQIERSLNLNQADEDFLKDQTLDIMSLLLDEIVSEFPSKVLCSDDCKGLCEKCGVNLNDNECSCDRGHIDIRMAHLKDLFDSKFKEV